MQMAESCSAGLGEGCAPPVAHAVQALLESRNKCALWSHEPLLFSIVFIRHVAFLKPPREPQNQVKMGQRKREGWCN